jgi:1,4-alpha-glucan branching enzyme
LETIGRMKKSLSKEDVGRNKHEVELTLSAPSAKKACIAGQFNDWNMTSMPMKKIADGIWKIKLKLRPGKYEYKFVVDGTWIQEMPCSEIVINPFGTYNCVLAVE